MKVDYLIVGSGFTGCVTADILSRNYYKKIMIIEKRTHIGGNAYDYFNNANILIHKYGPHIFRCNEKRVLNYLLTYTSFRNYKHRVNVLVDKNEIPLPINLN